MLFWHLFLTQKHNFTIMVVYLGSNTNVSGFSLLVPKHILCIQQKITSFGSFASHWITKSKLSHLFFLKCNDILHYFQIIYEIISFCPLNNNIIYIFNENIRSSYILIDFGFCQNLMFTLISSHTVTAEQDLRTPPRLTAA